MDGSLRKLLLTLMLAGTPALTSACNSSSTGCGAADIFCTPYFFFIWGRPESGIVISNLTTTSGGTPTLESDFLVGTAAASTEIQTVEVSLNGGPYYPAGGTTSWSYKLPSSFDYRTGTSHTVNVRIQSYFLAPSPDVSLTFRMGRNRDFNGDGYADLVLTAAQYDSAIFPGQGRAYIHYGRSDGGTLASGSATTADTVLDGEGNSDQFGVSAASGDLNGDGYADLIVGASGRDQNGGNAGAVYLYYGSANGISTTYTTVISGNTGALGFGSNVAAGDLNGDGYDDVVAGAGGYLGSSQGGVFVYNGRSTPLADVTTLTDADVILTGEAPSDEFAHSMDVGDLNGDGYDDLVVTAIGYPGGAFNGRSYVFYGRAEGVPSLSASLADVILTGTAGGNEFGRNPHISDLNNDGFGDLLVEYIGTYEIFYSSGGLVSANQGSSGIALQMTAARHVTSKDLNNDGYPEIIVGERTGSGNLGNVYLFTGRSAFSGTVTPDATYTGVVANGGYGGSVLLRDINGNGIPEFVGSASLANSSTGTAYIFYDFTTSTSADPSTAGTSLDGEGTLNTYGTVF